MPGISINNLYLYQEMQISLLLYLQGRYCILKFCRLQLKKALLSTCHNTAMLLSLPKFITDTCYYYLVEQSAIISYKPIFDLNLLL